MLTIRTKHHKYKNNINNVAPPVPRPFIYKEYVYEKINENYYYKKYIESN
jgi:hypothetical protein